MRKCLQVILIQFLILGLIVTMLPASSLAGAKPIEWKFGTVYPRGVSWGNVYHSFCENVKRMSGGRLIINDIYEGEGITATEILDSIRSGLIEMGAPYQALHVGELPAGIIELGLPGGPTKIVELMTLFQRTAWKETLRNAYATNNTYWLGIYFQPGTYVLTKKPINSLDDFKKLKIRCPGAYGKMLRYLGASPVVMAIAEVYTSIATGALDGVDGCNLVDHFDGKHHEVAPYMYPLPITGAQCCPVVVNMQAFKKLPDDLQTILEQAAIVHAVDQTTWGFIWEREALQTMIKEGLKMSPKPSEEDKARWAKAGRKVWGDYEKKDKFSKELIKIQSDFLKKIGY